MTDTFSFRVRALALGLLALAPRLAVAQESTAVPAATEVRAAGDAPLPWRVADRVVLLGAPAETTGVIFGLHGLADSSSAGTSGAMGESTATSGETIGVYGSSASGEGVAGWFEHPAGGLLLSGASDVPAFTVDGAGAVAAVSFVGDGSQLVGGGGLSCIGCIGSSEIANQTITAVELASGAVGSSQIAGGAVRSAKFSPGAVGVSEVAAGAVGTAKIADGAVTTSEIDDGAVGGAALADGAVGSSAVGIGAVTAAGLSQLDRIYVNHDDCSNPGEITLARLICFSIPCQLTPPVLFLDCAGNCSASSSQSCDLRLAGYLIRE